MQDVFKEKVCIITGGTSGIGFALAEQLLQCGAVVYAVGIPSEQVEQAQEKLNSYEQAHCRLVDVTKYEEVQRLVDEVVVRQGRLDYMFNNAGLGGTLPFEKVTLEYWKKVVDVNLWGVIYGVHAAFPVMFKQGFGHIINTSSLAGLVAPPYQAVYCATKFAVTGMTEALRYEHAHRNIAFSTVCPANVITPIFGGVKPPADAVPVEEAVEIILDGVAKKEGLIILPEKDKQQYYECRANQEEMDRYFKKMADDRRKAYETGGNYY